MLKIWNRIVNLGISEDLNGIEIKQVKMVNFGALFVTLAGLAFFFSSFRIGNLTLSIALIACPFYYISVFISQYYLRRKLARNLLYFGLCVEVTCYSLLDNPSAFTLNYFFGVAMLAFIMYNNKINRVLGVLFCTFLYFVIGYIQPYIQDALPFDPVIYVLDVITLFLGIVVCLNYFHKINHEYNVMLMNQKLELERVNVNKTKLISILTHDIRNPINALNHLLSSQPEKEFTNEELNFLLTKIKTEFVTQFNSINTLLDWSKTQLTELNTNVESTRINDLIHSIIKDLNYNTTQKNISVTTALTENDLIEIDKTHLIIILRNLMMNAIKFTKNDGHISLTTTRDTESYKIDIYDDGKGFEGYSHHHFEPLTTSKVNEGTNHEKGNGMGLLLSKELAEKNQAKLFVKNNKHHGTTVRLDIDLK
jgi:signal transduction histidine kinase